MNKIFTITLLWVALMIAPLFPALALETANEPNHYVQISVIADNTTPKAGDTITLGIVQDIYPTWHTYWKNPGDSGTPTAITWTLPDGFYAGDFTWPTPLKIPYGPLTNYGYEDTVTLLQPLTLPADYDGSPITLSGRVDLLVCHDICIPESHDVSVTLNGNQAAAFERIDSIRNTIPEPLLQSAQFHQNAENFILEVEDSSFLKDKKFFIAPEEWGLIENSADATLIGNQIVQEKGDREWYDIPGDAYFVLVDDNKNAYRIQATKGNNKATQAQDVSPMPSDSPAMLSINIPTALLFAFLGGIILNLMPCVFPVLSMKALSLTKLGHGEESMAQLHGISYTLGILVSFGLIAALLIALQSTGAEIGWGFHLQNPMIITLLIYLIFLIGLNLLGTFEFSNPFANAGQKLTQSNGNKGAFFTGVLATLVATPCTAPFMGTAMGFALTQPAAIAMLIFLALGFGLAFPYIVLCFVPALRSRLPKPGLWMEKFKEFLAFPMFLTAAWLLWVLSQQSTDLGIFYVALSLTLIGFTVWMLRSLPAKGIGRMIAILAIILSVFFIVASPLKTLSDMANKQEMVTEIDEVAFSPALLDELLEGDQGIFTNMTAAWCITCNVNERVALQTNSVQTMMHDNNILYLKGDWTNQNPDITHYLESFGRSGVPLYVFYPPRNPKTGERGDSIVLPQLLTPSIVTKKLEEGLQF